MADDKKNISPQQDTPADAPQEKKVEPVKETPPAPEQPAPGTPEAPVVETAPKEQKAPTVENKPEEKAAPTPKVLDFTTARGDAGKLKATTKEAAAPEDKPKRGRPAKAEKISYAGGTSLCRYFCLRLFRDSLCKGRGLSQGNLACYRGPRRSPAKRVRWGEEEQRNE